MDETSLPEAPSLRRGPALEPGARLGIVAPGSPPRDPDQLKRGLATLRKRGYKLVLARSFEPYGYLCGSDAVRLREFNDFLRRDDIDGLVCVRGGFGALRLLPHLDYEAVRAHPKLLVGYSDVTALHLALYHRAGVAGLSGPMVAVEWPEPHPSSEELFWAMARGAAPQPLVGPDDERLQPVRPGTHEGVLLGGNLSMIVRLIGTPFLPPLAGTILFLEEIGEQPYRIDALFAQLKLSGVLEELGGLVLGAFTEWEPEDDRPTLTPDEVLDHYTADLDLPVARGLVYGHFPAKNSLPIGVRARLSVDEETASLDILEPVVEEA